MHRSVEPRVLYFGTPVVLISTSNEDGSPNLSPMSSAWWVDHSAMLGLDEASQTTLNMKRTGECVLNLPSATMVDAVDRLAMFTGTRQVPPHKAAKGYQFEPDKFSIAELTTMPSDLVHPPRVAECPVQLEAVVEGVHAFGGHDSGLVAFEVRVVRSHIDDSILIDGSDRYIDPQRWDPLIMKFCEFFGGGTNLRPSRLAEGWQMPRVTLSMTSAARTAPHPPQS